MLITLSSRTSSWLATSTTLMTANTSIPKDVRTQSGYCPDFRSRRNKFNRSWPWSIWSLFPRTAIRYKRSTQFSTICLDTSTGWKQSVWRGCIAHMPTTNRGNLAQFFSKKLLYLFPDRKLWCSVKAVTSNTWNQDTQNQWWITSSIS